MFHLHELIKTRYFVADINVQIFAHVVRHLQPLYKTFNYSCPLVVAKMFATKFWATLCSRGFNAYPQPYMDHLIYKMTCCKLTMAGSLTDCMRFVMIQPCLIKLNLITWCNKWQDSRNLSCFLNLDISVRHALVGIHAEWSATRLCGTINAIAIHQGSW